MGGKEEPRPMHHFGYYNQNVLPAPLGSEDHGGDFLNTESKKPQPREEVQPAHHSSGSGIGNPAFSSQHWQYYSSANCMTGLVSPYYPLPVLLVNYLLEHSVHA